MGKKKNWIYAAVAVAIVFSAAYVGSPFLAISSLKAAAEARDADRLSRVVDFPAVRESLKGQLNAMFAKKLGSDPELKDNPFAGLAFMMAPMMVEKAVDGFVTADGLATMLDTGKPKPTAGAGKDVATASGAGSAKATPSMTSEAPEASSAKAEFNYRYKDLDTFVATSANKVADGKVDFVFRRDGLFRWRLVRINLPANLMD